ncbi:MAG: LamG domain-containing protein [Microcystis aeruginosa Ma_MB_F_20061100_S19]|uniref:LamG-like jellyroll fold domain-containing protein n=2 Tax=Microcystis aeruginosa TaxID=1126 RepID=S3IX92_MICAE|nr:LamG domain-containing protein [Microcystis aeruginosa]NCR96522.1 LamG domain-containing protein [Microcystis aeruginosa L311-01]OCY12246.1 MAG: PEP-CTERM domain protein [Microcystis aeruginosa CACIAM 03]REJ56559.1 MAG: LamG domain-containing protein [Microcystis aeruginosa DA14]TRU11630.1 MAG: LamG domain-containing protein [Microcystis aeruginosa Ma_MB_F_20061100_S19D]TRU16303.1 MAG: LamG domain-containing protein [Microcystis aeruginosa Ma_MB_F_20061100_S19]
MMRFFSKLAGTGSVCISQSDQPNLLMKGLLTVLFSASLVTAYSSVASAALPNTVSRWAADGNALDSVDSNNGTLINGVTFGTGQFGQAFSLNGTNQYVDIPDSNSLDITNALTISAWINPTTVTSPRIVDKITVGVTDGYLLDILGGSLRMIAGSRLLSGGTVATNTFQNVAGVYDGQFMRLYINGVQVASNDFGSIAPIPTNNRSLKIGVDSTGNGNLFSGLIDEVNIFNRALSASEIGQLALNPNNVSVPEPTSTLGLLALGTLGAASTLKRKLKSSQSTEKETTKVG